MVEVQCWLSARDLLRGVRVGFRENRERLCKLANPQSPQTAHPPFSNFLPDARPPPPHATTVHSHSFWAGFCFYQAVLLLTSSLPNQFLRQLFVSSLVDRIWVSLPSFPLSPSLALACSLARSLRSPALRHEGSHMDTVHGGVAKVNVTKNDATVLVCTPLWP